MTSIKTKGPYYTAFFQLWGRYPIVKLVLFAGLALYDLVGDVAFLMAVRTYPLVALKAYIRTGSSPQITSFPLLALLSKPTGSLEGEENHFVIFEWKRQVTERGTWDAKANSNAFDDPDDVISCMQIARYQITRYQPGTCDAFIEYTEPKKISDTPVMNSANSQRNDAVYLAMPRVKELFPVSDVDIWGELWDYYANLHNDKAVEFYQTHSTCSDLMGDKTVECLNGLSSTNTQSFSFVFGGIQVGLSEPAKRLNSWRNIVLGSSHAISTIAVRIISYAILGIILFKEIFKAIGVLSFFFHPYFHNIKNFAFISNSPMTLLPLLCSPAFRNTALYVESSKEDSPWPLFWDLLLEDLPQLFLPIFLIYISRSKSTVAIYSLTGSAAMVLVAIIRLIPKLQREHVKAMSPRNSPSFATTTTPGTEMAAVVISPHSSPSAPAIILPPSIVPQIDELNTRMDTVEGGLQSVILRLALLEDRVLQHLESKASNKAPGGEKALQTDDKGGYAIV